MTTNASASTPLYRSIAADLRAEIERGDYDDAALPSENDLAARYGVSRGTIRQSFAFLRATGVVSSRRGARRQVRNGPRVQSMTELLSFSRWAVAVGERPSSRTLQTTLVDPSALVQEKLGLADGEKALHIERLRLLSGTPAMLESTYYPAWLETVLAEIDLDTESITERLEERGIIFADAEHFIDAVAATAREAELIDTPIGAPLLRTIRRTTDPAGVVLECSIDLYPGSAVSFVVRNSIAAGATSRINSPR